MYRSIPKTPEEIKASTKVYDQSEKERKDRIKNKEKAMGTLDEDINAAQELIDKGDPSGQKQFTIAMDRKKAYYVGKPFNQRPAQEVSKEE